MNSLAIIIPAYKDTFLRAALDSITAQTCKDFILYIGDDCSPYDIASIVQEYKNKINLIYHRFDKNLGGSDLVAQWERCIAMSKDEPYIWLFSDDDVMEPECVDKFLSLPEVIRNNYLVHFDIGVMDEFNEGKIELKKTYPTYLTAKEYLDKKLRGEIISFVVEFIFPRQVYVNTKGFQNYDLAWGADFMTWLKFASYCKGIYSINAKNSKVLWRKSNINISPDTSYPILVRKINSLIENAAYIKEYLQANNYKYNFGYGKFVWGEILRNCKFLSSQDIESFYFRFVETVGFRIKSYCAFWICRINNFFKK